MSLKSFHIVFIVAAGALALLFGVWGIDDWHANGVSNLRHQRHRPDHAGSRAVAEAAPMAAGFISLRDDDVGAVCFEPTRFGDRRRRAEDNATGFLHSPNRGRIRQTKVKADDPRPQLENEGELFFVKGRKQLFGLRDRSQPKFVEIG